MTGRFYPDKQIHNARVRRPVSGRVFAWLTLIAVAGAIVASGFVISARQHFDALTLGYQSEELRRQAAQLEEERDKLEAQLDRVSSAIELEQRAKKMGLDRPAAAPTKIRRPTSE